VVEPIAGAAELTSRNVQPIGARLKQVLGIKIRLDNSEGILRAARAADAFSANVPKQAARPLGPAPGDLFRDKLQAANHCVREGAP
jgi:hypothetical protein